MDTFKIEISKLTASFPAIGFTERIDLPLEYRPKRSGHYVEKFVTDDKFTTIEKNYPQQQPIRITSWDKYKCSLIVHEGQNIETIDIAGLVSITIDYETTHFANIIDFGEPVNISGSDHRQVEFTYYDTNTDNYFNIPINDFLSSDILHDLYIAADLNKLKIGATTYYTALNHKTVMPALEQDSEKINGIETVFKSNYQNTISIRLYVSESQAATLAALCPQLGQASVSEIVYTDKVNDAEYEAIERIIPEIKEIDYNLFQVDMKIKHLNLTINHY